MELVGAVGEWGWGRFGAQLVRDESVGVIPLGDLVSGCYSDGGGVAWGCGVVCHRV